MKICMSLDIEYINYHAKLQEHYKPGTLIITLFPVHVVKFAKKFRISAFNRGLLGVLHFEQSIYPKFIPPQS